MGIKLKITVSTFWLSSKVLKTRNIRTFYTHTHKFCFSIRVWWGKRWTETLFIPRTTWSGWKTFSLPWELSMLKHCSPLCLNGQTTKIPFQGSWWLQFKYTKHGIPGNQAEIPQHVLNLTKWWTASHFFLSLIINKMHWTLNCKCNFHTKHPFAFFPTIW